MAKKLSSGFEVLAFSDIGYEGMTVDLMFNNERVAQLSMDRGIRLAEVEFFTEFASGAFVPRFLLEDLLEALQEAHTLLKTYPPPTRG